MSTIHPYYITSQLFQLVEERVASIEVDKKLRPLASIFVKLFDDLDYNFSNELVPEALGRLIIFVEKDGVTSTVYFSKVQAFFTDEEFHLYVRVDDIAYKVVEPAEVEDEYEDLEEDIVEYEENKSISLEDDDSYIVIDGDQVIEEYELNDEISLEDENTYIVIDEDEKVLVEEDENIHNLSFDSNPIVLDHGYAELVTLASTTDIDELIEEQIDDLPAFKEVLDELFVIRKAAKKELKEGKKDKKSKKKSKKKNKKSKHKKDAKKGKDAKKELAAKIEKKLYKYIQEKELEKQLLTEFIQLKKQIDYILIQY